MGADFFDKHDKKQARPGEPEQVRTTIVGGRPPANGLEKRDIPRGMEVLIKKASVDPEFRKLLLERRSGAAKEIDLQLENSEAAMIDAIPETQLKAIIDNTRIPERHVAAFLGKTAAAMLLTVTLAATSSCGKNFGKPESMGIQPNPKDVTPPASEDRPVTKGISPDRIELTPVPDNSKTGVNQTGVTTPPPSNVQPPATEGIRPDLPEPKPDEPLTRGIRPDRP